MSRQLEQAAKKLAPLLGADDELRAAGLFEYPIGENGPHLALGQFQRERGFDPRDDPAYRERAISGYLGLTSSRLLLAKSPLLFAIKPKHVFVDEPIEECSLAWYDVALWPAEFRALHFTLPAGRFTSVFLPLKTAAMLRGRDREAFSRLADDVVAAFGDRAMQVEAPQQA